MRRRGSTLLRENLLALASCSDGSGRACGFVEAGCCYFKMFAARTVAQGSNGLSGTPDNFRTDVIAAARHTCSVSSQSSLLDLLQAFFSALTAGLWLKQLILQYEQPEHGPCPGPHSKVQWSADWRAAMRSIPSSRPQCRQHNS